MCQKLRKAGIALTLEQCEDIKRICQSVLLDSLLLDLFQELRQAGMALTLEQYDLLQQAVAQGYGLGGWQDLKRVCRLLWVKPCVNYDANIFDRTFDRYIQQHHDKMPVPPDEPVPELPAKTPPTKPPSILPQIPPRKKGLSTQKPSQQKVATAVETQPPSSRYEDPSNKFHFTPTNFPIQLSDVQVSWRLLRQAKQVGKDYELDIEATLYQIEREGIFTDVVMRPVRVRRTELLLLIDDSSAMIPFFPAFAPFIQAIDEHRITPAQIYRFTSYPDEYLYHWHSPAKAEPLTNILPKLHRNRTVALIFSDAGAATATNSQERIEGISKFLTALSPCIRQLIWLNPLPPERWEQTSAWTIDAVLNGKMLTYEPASLLTAARAIPQENMIQTWQMYPSLNNLTTRRIRVFEGRYGTNALYLAYHAAFPLTLTSDLLYCLRENFLPDIPWYAVADVLLSGLCQNVGYDLYEIEGKTRDGLLRGLYENKKFGEQRLKKLADFMSQYIKSRLQLEKNYRALVFGQRPDWTALAYLSSDQKEVINDYQTRVAQANSLHRC